MIELLTFRSSYLDEYSNGRDLVTLGSVRYTYWQSPLSPQQEEEKFYKLINQKRKNILERMNEMENYPKVLWIWLISFIQEETMKCL